MYRFAKHLQWKNKEKLEFEIPSKTDSRVRALVKWKKFKARIRMWRLGIKELPAIAVDGKVIFQGDLNKDYGLYLM
jgi:hypothetical protein